MVLSQTKMFCLVRERRFVYHEYEDCSHQPMVPPHESLTHGKVDRLILNIVIGSWPLLRQWQADRTDVCWSNRPTTILSARVFAYVGVLHLPREVSFRDCCRGQSRSARKSKHHLAWESTFVSSCQCCALTVLSTWGSSIQLYRVSACPWRVCEADWTQWPLRLACYPWILPYSILMHGSNWLNTSDDNQVWHVDLSYLSLSLAILHTQFYCRIMELINNPKCLNEVYVSVLEISPLLLSLHSRAL